MQTIDLSGSRAIPRRAHKKSKTGCRTCRIRKVKCDERRPLCLKCERHFTNLIACDFDNHEPILNPHIAAAQTRDEAESSRQPIQVISTGQRDGHVGRAAEVWRLPSIVAAGRIDPFEARPASMQPAPSVDALIGYSTLRYRSFPLYANQSLIGAWWPFVRENQLSFNVVLLLAALDRETLQGQYRSFHTQQLFDQCLVLLHQQVQTPQTGTNDHTIATLASLESSRGNVRAAQIHAEGLRKAVEVRGGLNAIHENNAMVANFVFWCTMVSFDEPAFLALTDGNEANDAAWLDKPTTATLLTHDGGEANLVDFGVDLATANMLHRVQQLSISYARSIESDTLDHAFTLLSSLCTALQHLLKASRQPSTDSPVSGLSQSCRLAGCLHLFTPQSGYFPDPTLMLHTLVHEIKTSLGQMIRAVGTKSHLLLWLLAVGAITAHAIPERAWLVGHLVLVLTDLEIGTWEEMRQHLLRLALHDHFCDVSFHALWEEVRRKQEAFGILDHEET